MTPEEFKEDVAVGLDSFVSWWLLKHATDPRVFPKSMGEGDWWEQFTTWDGEPG